MVQGSCISSIRVLEFISYFSIQLGWCKAGHMCECVRFISVETTCQEIELLGLYHFLFHSVLGDKLLGLCFMLCICTDIIYIKFVLILKIETLRLHS